MAEDQAAGLIVPTSAPCMHCRNRSFASLTSSQALHTPGLCPVERNNTLLTEQRAATQDFSISDFMKHAAVWLLVSAAVSLVLGLVFLWLFKWQAQTMTRLTIQLQIILPAAAGVSALFAGQIGAGIMMILMSLLAAAVFWLWWVMDNAL